MKENIYITQTPEETEGIGIRIAQSLKGGETILLSGDLGAGKTVLTKGLAKGLEIEDEVTSPTFAIHNAYEGRLKLNHFDFYRLTDEEEARMIGLDEIIGAAGEVAVCEWWENVPELFADLKTINISVSGSGDLPRKVVVRGLQP